MSFPGWKTSSTIRFAVSTAESAETSCLGDCFACAEVESCIFFNSVSSSFSFPRDAIFSEV